MQPIVIDEPPQVQAGQPSNGTVPAQLDGPQLPQGFEAISAGPLLANGPPAAQSSRPVHAFHNPPVNFSGNAPPAFNSSFQEPQTTPEGDLDGLRRLRDDIVAGAHPTFRPTAAQFLDHAPLPLPIPLPPVVTSTIISAPPPVVVMSVDREEEDRARQLEWEEEERERQEVEEELMLAQVLEQRKAERLARQSQRATGTSSTPSTTTPLPSLSLSTLPSLPLAPTGLAALPATPVGGKESRGQRKDREAADVQRLRAKRIEEDEREAADREEGEIQRSRAKRSVDDSDSTSRQPKRTRGSRGGKSRRSNNNHDDDRDRSPRGRDRSPRRRSPRGPSPRRRSPRSPSPRRPLTDLGSLAVDTTAPIPPPSDTAKADRAARPKSPVVVKVASVPLLRVGTLVEVVEQKKREPTPPPPTPAPEPHVRLTQKFAPLAPHPGDNNRWAPPAPAVVRPAGLPATPSATTTPAPGGRSAPSSPVVTSSTNMYVPPPITTPTTKEKDEPRWAVPKVEERKTDLPPASARRDESPRRIPDDRPRPRAPSPAISNYGERRRPLDDRPFETARPELVDRRPLPMMQRYDAGRQGDSRRPVGGERDERDRFAGPPSGRDMDDRYDDPPRGFEQDRRDGYDSRPLPFDDRDRRDARDGPGPTYRREASPPRQQQSYNNSGPIPFESRNGDRWEPPRDDPRYSSSRLPPQSNEPPRPPPSLQSRLNIPSSSGSLPASVNGREIIPGGRGLARPTTYPTESRSGPTTSSGPPPDNRRFSSDSRDSRSLPTSASSYQDRFDGPRRSPPPFDRRSPPPFDNPRGGPDLYSNSQNSQRGPPPFDGRRSPPPSFDRRSPPPPFNGSRGAPPPSFNSGRNFDGPAPYSNQSSFDNGRRSPPPPPQYNNNRPRSPPPQFNSNRPRSPPPQFNSRPRSPPPQFNNRPRSPPPQSFRGGGPPSFDQRSQFEGQGQRQGDVGGQRRFEGGRDEFRRDDGGGRDSRDRPMGRDMGRDDRPMSRDDRSMGRDGLNRDGPLNRGPPPSQDSRSRDSFNGPPSGWNDHYGPPRPSSPRPQRAPPFDTHGPGSQWKQGQYRQV